MADTKHIIEFGPKFCQAQFDFVLSSNIAFKNALGEEEVLSHWDITFREEIKEIVFDISLTEWISTEQITFLFAWIRNLKSLKKKITVALPIRYELSKVLTTAQIERFASKYKTKDGKPYSDNPYRIKRRTRSNAFLMIVYGLKDSLGLNADDFKNEASSYGIYNNEVELIRKSSNQIVPFSIFELPVLEEDVKLDTHFYDIINDNYGSSHITSTVFELKSDEKKKLIQNKCYSPFASKIIGNVITQELYTNSLQHSFENNPENGCMQECYLTAFLSDRWSEEDARMIFLETLSLMKNIKK